MDTIIKILTTVELANATYAKFTNHGIQVDLKSFFESTAGKRTIAELTELRVILKERMK